MPCIAACGSAYESLMRHHRIVTAVSGGLLVAALTAAPAQADPGRYLACVKGSLGGYVDEQSAVGIGRSVTQLLAQNVPKEAIANKLYSNGTMGFSYPETMAIVTCAANFPP